MFCPFLNIKETWFKSTEMYPIYPLCFCFYKKILYFLNQHFYWKRILEKSELKVQSDNFPPPSVSKWFYCSRHGLLLLAAWPLSKVIATVRITIGHKKSSAIIKAEYTPGSNNMYAGHVTYWSGRNNVGFETSFHRSCFTAVSVTLLYFLSLLH